MFKIDVSLDPTIFALIFRDYNIPFLHVEKYFPRRKFTIIYRDFVIFYIKFID